MQVAQISFHGLHSWLNMLNPIDVATSARNARNACVCILSPHDSVNTEVLQKLRHLMPVEEGGMSWMKPIEKEEILVATTLPPAPSWLRRCLRANPPAGSSLIFSSPLAQVSHTYNIHSMPSHRQLASEETTSKHRQVQGLPCYPGRQPRGGFALMSLSITSTL